MPVTKSAAKARRQTKKRTALNKSKVLALKQELKKLKKQRSRKCLDKIYSLTDRMVKARIIHKNKAKRIKSQAALLISQLSVEKKSLPQKARKTRKKSPKTSYTQ